MAAGLLVRSEPLAAQGKVDLGGHLGVAFRLVDDSYVGGPYLDEGLGGFGLTYGADLRIHAARFVLGAEAGVSRFEVRQSGRLVSGEATGRIVESIVSVLGGFEAWSSRQGSLDILAGPSFARGTPTLNDVPINQRIDGRLDPAGEGGDGSLALTMGVDFHRLVGRRVSLFGIARYSYLPEVSRRAQEIGVGRHTTRFGVGVLFRLAE